MALYVKAFSTEPHSLRSILRINMVKREKELPKLSFDFCVFSVTHTHGHTHTHTFTQINKEVRKNQYHSGNRVWRPTSVSLVVSFNSIAGLSTYLECDTIFSLIHQG